MGSVMILINAYPRLLSTQCFNTESISLTSSKISNSVRQIVCALLCSPKHYQEVSQSRLSRAMSSKADLLRPFKILEFLGTLQSVNEFL